MTNEIDLHGFTKLEAIEELVKFYNSRVKKGNLTPFEVIHGYGSSGVGGVLRTRIRGFLASFEDCLTFDSGKNPFENNPGITRIIPRKPLPDAVDLLGEEILDFCDTPKPINKITGKFHRIGEVKTLEAVKRLEKQGRIKVSYKGALKVYSTKP